MNNPTPLAKLLLFPLSKIYGAAVCVRNKMFDWGIIKQHEFDIPIITVGNIALGGTGKTPHTEYLVSLLKNDYKIGVLSRGYKRKTKGFVQATPHSTPRDIGDESYQIYHKFNRTIDVAVCEKRVEGIRRMMENNPELNLIILDDAFQHRYVKPKVAIVLTEYNRPYCKDSMVPYGRLRDSKSSISRADIVIATKCPDNIKPLDYRIFEKDLNLIPAQSLFFSRYRYGRLRPVFHDHASKTPQLDALTANDAILAISGIANPRPFMRFLKSFNAFVRVNVFPDHHQFSRKDIELIQRRFDEMAGEQKIMVTTEKDAVRLINNPYFPQRLKPYIYYLPVMVTFVDNEPRFNENQRFAERLNKLIKAKNVIHAN